MAEGVCGIVDDQVIDPLFISQEAQAVVIMDLHPLIIQGAGHLREIFPAYVHEHPVRFHHVDALDGLSLIHI